MKEQRKMEMDRKKAAASAAILEEERKRKLASASSRVSSSTHEGRNRSPSRSHSRERHLQRPRSPSVQTSSSRHSAPIHGVVRASSRSPPRESRFSSSRDASHHSPTFARPSNDRSPPPLTSYDSARSSGGYRQSRDSYYSRPEARRMPVFRTAIF